MDILDLLMREDLSQFDCPGETQTWRGGPIPPPDLLQYIRDVRKHLLSRDFPPPGAPLVPAKPSIARHIALGMKVKKVHEVDHFARYIDKLTSDISAWGEREITHLVDFGSGQNYLGRALAAKPYCRHVVAVESKGLNIEGAKRMDVKARLVEREVVRVNKKVWRREMEGERRRKKEELQGLRGGEGEGKEEGGDGKDVLNEESQKKGGDLVKEEGQSNWEVLPNDGSHEESQGEGSNLPNESQSDGPNPPNETQTNGDDLLKEDNSSAPVPTPPEHSTNVVKCTDEGCSIQHPTPPSDPTNPPPPTVTKNLQIYTDGKGSVQYIEHIIQNGDLTPVISQILDPTHIPSSSTPTTTAPTSIIPSLSTVPKPSSVNAMVISLHSCGNLVHHGLRSLLLNPSVAAVAMVGCCYNLVTERLGPPTYKLPTLRPNHPRLEKTGNAFDPNGFPMSEKLANYPLPFPPGEEGNDVDPPKGLRLNITSRMMAVQAPFNWGATDSELFFTRHFYRALLQRIFLDRGVISAPTCDPAANVSAAGHTSHLNTPTSSSSEGRGPGLSSNGTSTPLTIGTLRKFAYQDFTSYVRAAVSKLTATNSFCEVDPAFIQSKMESLDDEEIKRYEEEYREKKHELSVMWSLMAFSAGVVEAVIVVDRWVWLGEQESVGSAWAECVFEGRWSPRNFVVVGVKK